MKWKLLNETGLKTYALIFENGDEVMTGLTEFAREKNLKATQFTAIGAFAEAIVTFFDWNQKKYLDIPVNEQTEVLTLAGDIALKEGKPSVHAHVVLGRSDGSTVGGHLAQAMVRPTLEVILHESPEYLRKSFDEETQLFLIDAEK